MRQTLAIFVDAYRELNSKKLFWIVMMLSFLIVAVVGAVGIDSQGLTFLHWSLKFGPNTGIMSKEFFYKQVLFANLGIKFWLSWLATILALVSTAGMIPDFISGGSIDIALAKPIGRLRIFLTKYLAGLLFVALQVLVFSLASFALIGFRANVWEPRLLLAVPLVVSFFSYLYCICALLGLLTRSGIASLLLTMLIWGACFLITTAEVGIVTGKSFNNQRVELLDRGIERGKAKIAELESRQEKGASAVVTNAVQLPLAKKTLEGLEEKRKDAAWWQTLFQRLDTGAYVVKTALPKFGETTDLLDRSLLSEKDRMALTDDADDTPEIITSDDPDAKVDAKKVKRDVIKHKMTQPVWWIVGTSLGFECVILAICCWIFCRRDF